MQAKIFSFEPKGGAGYACKYTLKPSLGGLNPVSVSPEFNWTIAIFLVIFSKVGFLRRFRIERQFDPKVA
jgi:hypothetical protein